MFRIFIMCLPIVATLLLSGCCSSPSMSPGKAGDIVYKSIQQIRDDDISNLRESLDQHPWQSRYYRDTYNLVQTSILCESSEALRLLIAAGADPDIPDLSGCTPLVYACILGNMELTKELIDSGANPYSRDNDGWLPLHWAAWSGHTEIADFMLDTGYLSTDMDLALALCMLGRNEELKSLLLEKPWLINRADSNGDTLLNISTYYEDPVMLSLLIGLKADLRMQDSRGRTTLHQTARFGKTELSRMLLEGG